MHEVGVAFADRLKAARSRAGLSQHALARKAGLCSQAVSLLERGLREPGWRTVQRLALVLGVDFSEFADPGLAVPEQARTEAHQEG
jgi:transcriptional regulator with XRE-family HTH domain